jgi:hypothetical protein
VNRKAFMDILITKSTFEKPKRSPSFSEKYYSKGVRYNDVCRKSIKIERWFKIF